jgi:hypothetical protein
VRRELLDYTRRDLHQWGPANIFAEHDLYTTRWGNLSNTA